MTPPEAQHPISRIVGTSKRLEWYCSDIEGRAAILLVEKHPDGSSSSCKVLLSELFNIFAELHL